MHVIDFNPERTAPITEYASRGASRSGARPV
jgi:hypothetical protein